MPATASRIHVWLLLAALLGGSAVAFGAFGAHGLKARFMADGELSGDDERALANWQTAAHYQMVHALAVLAVAILTVRSGHWPLHAAGAAFTAGIVIFSGCLYVLVLTSQRWLGAVVPIGGVLLIVGWIMFAVAALTTKQP
jgi:uncharacterized membrane protein YgdD (TMEM256/DUF423 family)